MTTKIRQTENKNLTMLLNAIHKKLISKGYGCNIQAVELDNEPSVDLLISAEFDYMGRYSGGNV